MAVARTGRHPRAGVRDPPQVRGQVSDIGPMRAARRDALLDLGLLDRGFGWPLEMVLKAAAAG